MKKENMNELNKKVGFDVSKMKEAADNGKLKQESFRKGDEAVKRRFIQ